VSAGNIPYTVDVGLGRQICDAVEASAKSVMIPISRSPEEIREFARRVEPDIVQLANDETMLTRDTFTTLIKDLRGDGFGVIKVVAVGAGDEFETARYYSGVADYLMLDTFGAPPSELLKGFIGGTGKTSDWELGRRIVEGVKAPVILAGGLNLENVTAAIREVKPWGVDAASALSIPGTKGRKDMEKVRRFVALAKGA
jgi:phosphoribosylanthranilate isomerase